MKVSVEVYTEKPFFIKERSFIKTGIRNHGLVFAETRGEDVYNISCFMLSGKRLGGIARKNVYDYKIFSAGLGRGEARPGAYIDVSDKNLDDISLIIETNMILDPGRLREQWGIRLINEKGKKFEIPLKRPDIEIAWDGRGRYVIGLTEFINSKIFAA